MKNAFHIIVAILAAYILIENTVEVNDWCAQHAIPLGTEILIQTGILSLGVLIMTVYLLITIRIDQWEPSIPETLHTAPKPPEPAFDHEEKAPTKDTFAALLAEAVRRDTMTTVRSRIGAHWTSRIELTGTLAQLEPNIFTLRPEGATSEHGANCMALHLSDLAEARLFPPSRDAGRSYPILIIDMD